MNYFFRNLFFFILCFLINSYVVFAQEDSEYKVYKRKKYTQADSLKGALRFGRTCYDVHYYDLAVEINPKKKNISGSNQIHFKVIQPTKLIQVDLFENMKISKITYENNELKFTRKFNAVFIEFLDTLPQNSLQKIQIWYAGSPKNPNQTDGRHGFYWDKDEYGRNWVGLCCERLGASFWFPNKDHLSDEPDSMRMHYTFPLDLTCIGNGILEKIDTIDKKQKTYHWFSKNPINNYNVTFYLGYYSSIIFPYKNNSGEHEITAYFLDYEREKANTYFSKVPMIVKFFEDIYGEYPFWNEKLSIVQSPYAGMEHQTCVAIGRSLGINEDENWAYVHQIPWASVVPHEIAHEWWGNAVSASDMADIWLHEGFATYSELLLIEASLGNEAYLKEIDKRRTFIKYFYPLLGNRDINEDVLANGDVYYRSALVLHELREEIGDLRVFLAILKRFYIERRYKTVSSMDFINTVNEVTKKDYTKFLKDKLYKKDK